MKKLTVFILTLAMTCMTATAVHAQGYSVTDDLRIAAVIHTEEKGPVNAVWHKGGQDTTAAGDRVIWGYFYASPSDVDWGSAQNPDLFVKIWFDRNGRVDVNYFHVSVPTIDVYSDYPNDGIWDKYGVTNMSARYVRQYYENNQAYMEKKLENGYPPPEYSPAGNPDGYAVTDDLRTGAVIGTVEKGPVDALWYKGGEDATAGGHKVVWGFFYANPSDVDWGNRNNPDLFVKIWFDAGGRIDVNFFHVSVPDIEVYSDFPDDGMYGQKGTTILDNRYIRHEYWTDPPELDKDGDGYTVEQGDCNDNNASVYPGAEEVCEDGTDQDCNGTDLECPDEDEDGDGYTVDQGDCNDNDATVHPGADEVCEDGTDQDCNGTDMECPDEDVDGDGYTADQGDCNDNDASVYPGAEEVCEDGTDQDCNGSDLICNTEPGCNGVPSASITTSERIDENTWSPLGIKDVFSNLDEAVTVFITANNVANSSSFTVRCYKPDGTLYSESPYTVDLGDLDCLKSVQWYLSFSILNYEDVPGFEDYWQGNVGIWRIEVYLAGTGILEQTTFEYKYE